MAISQKMDRKLRRRTVFIYVSLGSVNWSLLDCKCWQSNVLEATDFSFIPLKRFDFMGFINVHS